VNGEEREKLSAKEKHAEIEGTNEEREEI